MNKLLILFVLLLLADFVSAQSNTCLTETIWTEMVKKDSSLYYKRKAEDDLIAKYTNNSLVLRHSGPKSLTGNPIVIPTVIYIVHDGSAEANISMQQIQSQMDQLNHDFETHGIQFCYATKNFLDSTYFVPQAGDSLGVIRINSSLTNLDKYTEDAQLKALSGLPATNYLRIFVVKSISPQGVLGYAYYPGTSYTLDGIVVRSDVFGSRNYCSSCSLLTDYDLGAALTHEAGHYLNLYHTFQGGCVNSGGFQACQMDGDRICDTPPTTGTFGCPSPTPLSCDGITPVMLENYMDYTNDACKTTFTPGQKARIDYVLNVYRTELTSTANLVNTGIKCISLSGLYANFDCKNFNGCVNREMTFQSFNTNGFTYSWNFGDGDTATGAIGLHTYTNEGQFLVTLTATNAAQGISESSSNTVFITACSPIACSYNKWEFNYGYLDFSSGTPIATNHVISTPSYDFPEFYRSFYRADSLGQPLFHISPYNCSLFDTSFSLIDTLGNYSNKSLIVPCPGGTNKFCLFRSINPNMEYSIIQANNGTFTIPPNKRKVLIHPDNGFYTFGLAGIPNCDGTKFWILTARINGILDIYELNSNDTVVLHQSYPDIGFGDYTVSPDGSKIVVGPLSNNNNQSGFYFLDFDKSNGYITSQYFYSPPNINNFGLNRCFSPNSRYLYLQSYCCEIGESAVLNIYQYDMYNANPDVDKKTIATNINTGNYFSIGPDNKIYLGYISNPINAPRTYRLGVINFPNVLENGLNSTGFNPNGPNIKPDNCPYSHINFMGFSDIFDHTDAFGCNWQPNPPPSFNYYSPNCYSYEFHSDDCYSHSWDFGDAASGANNTSTLSNPVHTFTAAGTYLVKLTINGETFTDTIKVELPHIQISETSLSSCPNQHANYSIASPQPGVTYSWNTSHGQPGYVPSASDVDITWNNTDSTGLVKVIAKNALGCIDSVSLPVVFQPCIVTGLTQPEEVSNILITPNPSSETFLISSSSKYSGAVELKVMDMIGRIVETKKYTLNGGPLHILLNAVDFPPAVYMLRLKTERETILKKIVKQ